MSEKEKISTSNIFEDFKDDNDIKKDVKNLEKDKKKDKFFYLSLLWVIFRYLNILLILLITILVTYIFIEKSENMENKSFLKPFCNLLLWVDLRMNNCSSLAVMNEKYDKKIELEKYSQFKKIYPILKDLDTIENFSNSKEVNFILDKMENKSNPLLILSEFDELKNKFSWSRKSKIKCSNINIVWNSLTAQCSASTPWIDPSIPWIQWNNIYKITWTSISLAASFLNYIEKDGRFKIINRQKMFISRDVTGEDLYLVWFTKRTDFNIKLEYRKINLSL